MRKVASPLDVSAKAPGVATGVSEASDQSGITPGTGRRYPRSFSEVGSIVGNDRVPVGLATFHELETAIVEDLGGETAVSVAKREVLAMALKALAVVHALTAEVEDKARRSRREGHTPYPSRYQALDPLARFMDLTARLFRDVGLGRKARRVDLESYLKARTQPQGEPIAPSDTEVAPAPARATAADDASDTERSA